MAKIVFANSYARIEGAADLFNPLRTALSYKVEGAEYTDAYKRGQWDGRKYLIRRNRSDQSMFIFPSGLLRTAAYVLAQNGREFLLEDKRNAPESVPGRPEWVWKGHPLRYYQTEAVEAALERKRGIWKLATGSGKTTTVAKFLQELSLPAFVIVHSKESIMDTVKELRGSIEGPSIGEWWEKKKSLGDITVCTVQSLYEKNVSAHPELLEAFLKAPVFVCDEIHTGGGATESYDLLMRSDAYYRIGQSGTPQRGDGKDILLQACTGRIIYEKNAADLQKEGFLVRSNVSFVESYPPNHMKLTDFVRLDPKSAYEHGIVKNMPRNIAISDILNLKALRNKSFVVLVKRHEHGEILSELLGVPFVHGKCTTKFREEIRERILSGELKRLVATTIFDQSVNFPNLDGIVNAGGHSPENAQTQRHGRVLRTYEGKECAYFFDFYDSWESRMKKHSRARIRYMEDEGHEVHFVSADAPAVYGGVQS